MSKEDFFQIIDDRLEGWELAELLDLSAVDILNEFEDKLTTKKIKDLKELLDIEDDTDEIEDDTEFE